MLCCARQLQGTSIEEFATAIVTGACPDSGLPGDIAEFGTSPESGTSGEGSSSDDDGDDGVSSSSSSEDDDDSTSVVLLEEEGDDDGICAGVNCVDEAEVDEIPEADKIDDIETNELAGTTGLGECETVLSVVRVKSEHRDDRDTSTSPDNLFDGGLNTHYSVNRESTYLTLELEEETEIHGVSIGFFMKDPEEERIQTFDVSARSSDEDEYTTLYSRKESSGAMGDIQHFEFSSPVKAMYVKVESHGNTENK